LGEFKKVKTVFKKIFLGKISKHDNIFLKKLQNMTIFF